MLSISQQISQQPVKKVFIGYGDEAIHNTLRIMRDLIIRSSVNNYVRRWAEKIVEGATSNIDRVRSIYDFIARHSYYLKDPSGFEFIKTPPVSLQLIEVGEKTALDCDDFTVLSLSLLKSIGFHTALKAIAIRPDKKFVHVYGLVEVEKDKWMPIDLTKPENGLGWEWPNPTRITEMVV
jgi:transglutaminase-like putative cysteine protease